MLYHVRPSQSNRWNERTEKTPKFANAIGKPFIAQI
jgi:hypothetical protein